MNLFTKRFGLVLAGVIGVGAVASLAMGASFALFSSTATTQNNSVTAGALSVTEGADSTAVFNTPVLEPGPRNGVDTQALGSYDLDYTGTINGFVGLDFTITSTASQACTGLPGGDVGGSVSTADLNDCTNSGSLPLFLSGGTDGVTLTVNENGSTTPNNSVITDSELLSDTTCSASGSSVVTCTATINDIELPSSQITTSTSDGEWTNGQSISLGLNIWLPPTAGNPFQGSTAQVTLTGFAVQYDNNNISSSPSSNCAAGTNLYYPDPTTCPSAWS